VVKEEGIERLDDDYCGEIRVGREGLPDLVFVGRELCRLHFDVVPLDEKIYLTYVLYQSCGGIYVLTRVDYHLNSHQKDSNRAWTGLNLDKLFADVFGADNWIAKALMEDFKQRKEVKNERKRFLKGMGEVE